VPPPAEECPRCPYCLADLEPDEERVRCEGCTTPHHAECFAENSGCSAYGCRVQLAVPSGQSIYVRKQIKIVGGARIDQYDLGPFLVSVRTLPRQRERRTAVRPSTYTRVSLEDSEVRAGAVLKGQVVLYVSEATKFKRLDLELRQGISAPHPVARVELPLQQEEPHQLAAGTYPLEIELVAPDYSPPVDPFQLRLVLVKSMFKELCSEPQIVFLLKRKVTLPAHLRGLRGNPDGNAIVLSPQRRRISVRPSDRLPQNPFARSHEPDPFARSEEDATAPRHDPFASAPRAQSADDPFATDALRGDKWTRLRAGNPPGSRTLRGRLFLEPSANADRIEVSAPRRPGSAEFALQVTGGGELGLLVLGVHVELVRPGGGVVEAEGFPDMEEVSLVGSGGFPPAEYQQRGGVDLLYVVPPPILERLAAVRRDGAHNAALRLRFAADAMTRAGRRLSAPSRSVTLTTCGPPTS
jgi:hypothetical protein